MKDYTCAMCHGDFKTDASEAESMEEYVDNGFTPGIPTVRVCDVCYEENIEEFKLRARN